MDHDSVADDTGFVLVVYLTVNHQTTGNSTHLRYLEHLLHLNLTRDDLLFHLVEHTLHGLLHIVDSVVDDRVGIDLDAFALSGTTGIGRRTYLEANDDSLGSRSQHDIVLRDLTHSL